jgi:hypothetical protein
MAPKYALLSGALPRALPACAGRDHRWATGVGGTGGISHGIDAKAPGQLAVGLTEMVSTARGRTAVKASKEVSSQMTYCKPTWQFWPDGAGCVQRT